MKRTYTLFQQYIAYVLLISFFLQSCGDFSNSPLPNSLKEDSKEIDYRPILDKKFIAEGGYQVTFYEYKDKLLASVEPLNEKQKVYNGLPVEVKTGVDLRSFSHQIKKVQENCIHLQLAQDKQPVYIHIRDWGLKGGGKKKNKGKQKQVGSTPKQVATSPVSMSNQSSSSSISTSTEVTRVTETNLGVSHPHYGGTQGNEIFQQRSINIINGSANHIKTLVEYANSKGKPLSDYFEYFLGLKGIGLAQKRREVAIETNSEDAGEFGVFREVNPKLFHLMEELGYKPSIEFLFNIHKRNELLRLIQEKRTGPFTGGASIGAFITDVPLEKYGAWRNILCSYFLELFNSGKMNDEWIENRQKTSRYKVQVLPYNFNNFLYGKSSIPSDDYRVISECHDLLTSAAPSKEILLQEEGRDPRRIPTNIYQLDMNVKLNSRYIPSTRIYFTIKEEADKNFSTPAEREIWLRDQSRILVFHPYPECIDFFLKETAIRWQRAVEWDKQNIEDLKGLLASYSHIMFNAAPFKRGSASITEWSLKAIAKYHGYKIDWPSWREIKIAPDQVALSTPFIDEFIDKFNQNVNIEKL